MKKLQVYIDADEHLPSNCCVQVLAEFIGGHNSLRDHPEKITNAQWKALLAHTGSITPLMVFSGRVDQNKHNFSPLKLANALRSMEQTVTEVRNRTHVLYTVKLDSKFIRSLDRINLDRYFKFNDWGCVDTDYE